MSGIHLFDEHAGMAGSKQMNQPVIGDAVSKNIGGLIDCLKLRGANPVNNRLGRLEIVSCSLRCHEIDPLGELTPIYRSNS